LKKLGLSAHEKIKSRKDYEEIYSKGITIFSSTKKIKAVYIIDQNSNETGIRISVAVGRKSGNAVWRNRIKRLLRESYRLNKYVLLKKIEDLNFYMRIIFSPYTINMKKNKDIYLKEIMPDVIEIMSNISSDI
jgi:ribonuclease P protein component